MQEIRGGRRKGWKIFWFILGRVTNEAMGNIPETLLVYLLLFDFLPCKETGS